jgi:hypothetical protein
VGKRTDRLARLAEHVDSLPVRPDLVDTAFAEFRATGVLPDEVRVAALVIERVRPPDPEPVIGRKARREVFLWLIGHLEHLEAGEPLSRNPWADLRHVLRHAVHGEEPVRSVARRLLVMLAEAGLDPTQPQSLADGVAPDAAWPLIREVYAAQLHDPASDVEEVGPPLPQGQAMIDYLKDCVRIEDEMAEQFRWDDEA